MTIILFTASLFMLEVCIGGEWSDAFLALNLLIMLCLFYLFGQTCKQNVEIYQYMLVKSALHIKRKGKLNSLSSVHVFEKVFIMIF